MTIPTCFEKGELQSLASRWGTPLFVYNGRHIDRTVALVKDTIGTAASVYYSAKANLNPFLIRALSELGCGFEVASGGELEIILEAGVAPDRIVYAGPGKTSQEIEAALAAGIDSFNVESLNEIMTLEELSCQSGEVASICLRVNPDTTDQPNRRKINWFGINPFGIDEQQLPAVFSHLRNSKWLRCKGVHLHSSSGLLDSSTLCSHIDWLVAKSMTWATEIDLEVVNLGGGWGQASYQDDVPLDLEPVKRTFGELGTRHERIRTGRTSLIVESGRFLIGSAGVYVAQVLDIKSCRGTDFIVLDGGINHCLFQSNAFRTVSRPILVDACRANGPKKRFEIVGPLCTPIDKLASAAMLPSDIAPGDFVYFPNSGAYAKAASPLNFLGHPWPKEVLVTDGNEELIASSVTMKELMRLQQPVRGADVL